MKQERWKTLNDFGLHAENLSTLPGCAPEKKSPRYAGMTSVFNIADVTAEKDGGSGCSCPAWKRWRWMMH